MGSVSVLCSAEQKNMFCTIYDDKNSNHFNDSKWDTFVTINNVTICLIKYEITRLKLWYVETHMHATAVSTSAGEHLILSTNFLFKGNINTWLNFK